MERLEERGIPVFREGDGGGAYLGAASRPVPPPPPRWDPTPHSVPCLQDQHRSAAPCRL